MDNKVSIFTFLFIWTPHSVVPPTHRARVVHSTSQKETHFNVEHLVLESRGFVTIKDSPNLPKEDGKVRLDFRFPNPSQFVWNLEFVKWNLNENT